MLKRSKYIWVFFVLVSLALNGCKEILNVEPEEVLLENQFYKNKSDAYVASRAIYGQLMELAEQIVVLNELRADLMDVTVNSNQDLRDINAHNVSVGNKYADPMPFYKVINNCNDILSNFNRMKKEKTLLTSDYNLLYSDVGAVRSWLYYQLAIHFGNIPYVTEPVTDVADVMDDSKFPVLSLQEVIVKLIEFMESLPDFNRYVDESLTGDDDQILFINKRFLLGDLYLWNNEYLKAASAYKDIMESFGDNNYDRYRVIFGDVINHDDLVVGYVRYRGDDVLSLIEDKNKGWRSIFTRVGGKIFLDEWIWAMNFKNRYEVANPFIQLFANEGEGQYLVGPSRQVLDYWEQQEQKNQIPWDARSTLSCREMNGELVITKYIENYDPAYPFERSGFWYLNRAALLHLRFAEAANRDGHPRLAHALLNDGIKAEYDVAGALDITNLQRTLLPYPYNFDARMDQTGQIPVGVRDPWHRNTGIRSRANLKSHVLGEMSVNDSIAAIENQLIEEAALELAFEGHRWSDLVRIALRNNDPAFLANKIADKLEKSGNAEAGEVRAKLMDPENWFLPFPK